MSLPALTPANMLSGARIRVKKGTPKSHQQYLGKPGTVHVIEASRRPSSIYSRYFIYDHQGGEWHLYAEYLEDFEYCKIAP